MRVFLIMLLLAGCANKPPVASAPLPLPIAEIVPDAPPDTRRTTPTPKRATAKITEPVKKLPPCEVDPTDTRTAILQKMDCVIESTKALPKP
jgi:hypothetical protein